MVCPISNGKNKISPTMNECIGENVSRKPLRKKTGAILKNGRWNVCFYLLSWWIENKKTTNETSLKIWTTFTLFIACFVRTKQPLLPNTTRQGTLRTYELDTLKHGNAAKMRFLHHSLISNHQKTHTLLYCAHSFDFWYFSSHEKKNLFNVFFMNYTFYILPGFGRIKFFLPIFEFGLCACVAAGSFWSLCSPSGGSGSG